MTEACFVIAMLFVPQAYALDMPPGTKQYYKDKVSSAPGTSEGVGPTKKAKKQEGVDIGRRQSEEYDFSDESSSALTLKAWEALNKKKHDAVLAYTSRCIELYESKAKDEESILDDFASSGSEADYAYLNDVGTCYFIQGELYKYQKDWQKAKEAYQKLIDDFYFAQYWDPRGWWWKPSEIAKDEIKKIDSGYYENK
jgi:tetratricopeptide (TPR) repeat protein